MTAVTCLTLLVPVGSKVTMVSELLPSGRPRSVPQTKVSAVFEHVFESYQGEGASVYTM
jgi:hypothetical protein